MKFLKGLALAILSFLLFLSLSVFGLVFTLNQTILNPDFIVRQFDRIDIPSLAGEMLTEQIPQEMEGFIAEAMNDTIADLEPWIKEQVGTSIYSLYDYLEGRSESLSLVISLAPMKDSLRENLREAVLESPPAELAGLPPAEIERGFNEFYSEFSEQMPSTFEVGEALLGTEVLEQLEQVRQVIGYVHLTYNILIGLILVLILLIVLLNRQVRSSTRKIGITFLTCGVPWLAGILIAKRFTETWIAQIGGIPSFIQELLPQLVNDSVGPLQMFSIGLLAAGVVLLIVSFVYKPREASI